MQDVTKGMAGSGGEGEPEGRGGENSRIGKPFLHLQLPPSWDRWDNLVPFRQLASALPVERTVHGLSVGDAPPPLKTQGPCPWWPTPAHLLCAALTGPSRPHRPHRPQD